MHLPVLYELSLSPAITSLFLSLPLSLPLTRWLRNVYLSHFFLISYVRQNSRCPHWILLCSSSFCSRANSCAYTASWKVVTANYCLRASCNAYVKCSANRCLVRSPRTRDSRRRNHLSRSHFLLESFILTLTFHFSFKTSNYRNVYNNTISACSSSMVHVRHCFNISVSAIQARTRDQEH